MRAGIAIGMLMLALLQTEFDDDQVQRPKGTRTKERKCCLQKRIWSCPEQITWELWTADPISKWMSLEHGRTVCRTQVLSAAWWTPSTRSQELVFEHSSL